MKQTLPNRGGSSVPPPRAAPIRPPGQTTVTSAENAEQGPDRPLADHAPDSIDPDLRHRMISDAAYHLYEKRGCVEGYAMDDWLKAEAALDPLLLERKTAAISGA